MICSLMKRDETMVTLRQRRRAKEEAATTPAAKKAQSTTAAKSTKPAAKTTKPANQQNKNPPKKTEPTKPKAATGREKKLKSAATKSDVDTTILEEFLSTKVPNEKSKHDDITWLYHTIRSKAPSSDDDCCRPELQGDTTLAFGGFDYETKSKCSGRWSRMSIMVNKTGLTLMVSGMKDGKYLLEHYDKKKIGKKVSMGKSCIRFPSLETINRNYLEEIIQAAAEAEISPLAKK